VTEPSQGGHEFSQPARFDFGLAPEGLGARTFGRVIRARTRTFLVSARVQRAMRVFGVRVLALRVRND